MSLKVAEIPLVQHTVVLGKTRSGKSSVMRLLVERVLDAGEPVCVVDPKGDWWGLKLSKNGKSAGYPVVIFGGDHADVPISEHSGAGVAELFATGNRSMLIDLGGWMVGERTRFWIDFASTLFKLNRGKRHLVVDEIHNFAPKGKIFDPDAGKALHWANRLASEGLGRGISMIFASQRPQKVHNDTLTSAETLIAMRVLHKADRDAISEWVKGCGDERKGHEVLNSLAQMDRGEAWVWSPEAGIGPERLKFPLFKTYDSFRPQTVEETESLRGWAEVDLEEVKTKLHDAMEERKANDPRLLKVKIAELARQLAASPKQAAEVQVQIQEVVKERVPAWLFEVLNAMGHGLEEMQQGARVIEDCLVDIRRRAPLEPVEISRTKRVVDTAAHRAPASTPKERTAHAISDTENGLSKMVCTLLTVLAQAAGASMTKQRWRILAGYASSGKLSDAFGEIMRNGWAEKVDGDQFRISREGRIALGPYAPLPTGDELRESVLSGSKLNKMEKAILAAVCSAYPSAVSKADVQARTGYAVSGKLSDAFAHLVGFGYVEQPAKKMLRAVPDLFDQP